MIEDQLMSSKEMLKYLLDYFTLEIRQLNRKIETVIEESAGYKKQAEMFSKSCIDYQSELDKLQEKE